MFVFPGSAFTQGQLAVHKHNENRNPPSIPSLASVPRCFDQKGRGTVHFLSYRSIAVGKDVVPTDSLLQPVSNTQPPSSQKTRSFSYPSKSRLGEHMMSEDIS